MTLIRMRNCSADDFQPMMFDVLVMWSRHKKSYDYQLVAVIYQWHMGSSSCLRPYFKNFSLKGDENKIYLFHLLTESINQPINKPTKWINQ